jgi:hypothetical protein
MDQLLRFWHLTRCEKLLLFEACALLMASKLSLKAIAFRHVDWYLRRWESRKTSVSSGYMQNDIRLVDLSLTRAANLLPWKSLCLTRSIAKLVMLRRRGIPAVLFAGVKSLEDASLVAHAWVCPGDYIMNGSSDESENVEFTVLVRIGQGSLPDSSRS